MVDHGERFLEVYESRYGESHGTLSSQAKKVIEKLLNCGDPHYGLTLLHCHECNLHMAVPFSCKTRVCPSCINRRAECLSSSLADKLPDGDYRHIVVTLPIKMGLRKRLQMDTRLHRHIGRLVHRVLGRWMLAQTGCHRNKKEEKSKARPGIVMAVQTFGAGLKPHVHYHLLVSDGVYFPDGDFYALGHWDQPDLLGQLRHSILKSLVARHCLLAETAQLMESWPLDRSGFSVFIGEAIHQPTERPSIQRVLNYIFRPSLALKHLSYKETTAQVTYSPLYGTAKIWGHAYDFLADWVQHIPRARQHLVTYAGWFSNALSKLNPKNVGTGEEREKPRKSQWVPWKTLILRTWAVDPENCPRCQKPMQRSKALLERHELNRLLENLGIGAYPIRPRSPPPSDVSDFDSQDSGFADPESQVPVGWDEWDAA